MFKFDDHSIEIFEIKDMPEDRELWQAIIKEKLKLTDNHVYTLQGSNTCYVIQTKTLGNGVRKLKDDNDADVGITMKIFEATCIRKNKIPTPKKDTDA